MQKILSYVRRACLEFDLISDGDKVAVGLSGGKDSLVLLAALAHMQRYMSSPKFELCAVTMDPMFFGKKGDFSAVQRFCAEREVPWTLFCTDIYEIVFEARKEKNPCSLCAKMRRGALHDAALELGCNKIAFAHSFDDVVETFVMNLFKEGRVGCFSPKSYLSRKDLTLIRPLVFVPESTIIGYTEQNKYPIVKSLCPIDKATYRQEIKEFLAMRELSDSGFKHRMFTALRKSGVDGWGIKP